MSEIEIARIWIESNETLLSGAAAAIFIATLFISAMSETVSAWLRRIKPAQGEPGAAGEGANESASQTVTPEQLLKKPAVAVLPFENRSSDPDQDYLAAGITESLIAALSSSRSFPVIGRASVFALQDGSEPMGANIPEIARQLRARYITVGSVCREGSQLRIGVQLIDGESGQLLWARTYDRQMSGVFALQDEMTAELVNAIEPKLGRAEERRALAARDDQLDAWDCSLRALWHVRKGSLGDFREAQKLLEYAIVRDPQSSHAHSILALCQFQTALLGWSEDPARALAGTLRAARAAVALDDEDWLAHGLLGIASLWTLRDYDFAIDCQRRALELNPSACVSHQFMGCVLEFAGRPEEAIHSLQIVLELEPRYQSHAMVLADLALCHLMLSENEAAIEHALRALALEPRNLRVHHRLVAALGRAGRQPEARAAYAELLLHQPDLDEAAIRSTYPFRREADLAILLDGLAAAGMPCSAIPEIEIIPISRRVA